MVCGIRFGNEFRKSTQGGIFIRFLLAGAANSLFGFAVYSGAVVAGAAIWLALLSGMLAGTVFNFVTTGGYAFRRLSMIYFPRFLSCYLAVYATNLLLLETLGLWSQNFILSQALITPPLAVLSYFMMSRFVFCDRKTTSSRRIPE